MTPPPPRQVTGKREATTEVEPGLGGSASAAEELHRGSTQQGNKSGSPVFAGNRRQKICLSMIVKNEAPVIVRCLQSVRPIIDYWVIVDTGSSDGTQDTIRKYLHDIPGELHERPWVDFAHNRSEALSFARAHGDYTLVIDADDVLELPLGFKMPRLKASSYTFNITHMEIRYWRAQLFRNDIPWRFEGVLHEFPSSFDENNRRLLSHEMSQKRLHGPLIRMSEEGARRQVSESVRYARDAALLESALETETDPFLISRYTFYLAQSYRNCGNKELALKNYLKRADLGYWTEEVFESLLCAAKIKSELGYPDDEVIAAYLRAADTAPTRAEALHWAARYCRIKKRFQQGYDFAKRALKIKPPSEGLYLEEWVYQYGVLDEFAVNAFWIGRYDDCLKACKRLLQDRKIPEGMRERIELNMRLARDRLAMQQVKKTDSILVRSNTPERPTRFNQPEPVHGNKLETKRTPTTSYANRVAQEDDSQTASINPQNFHKSASSVAGPRPKIFVVSLHRSGTQSVTKFLRSAGVKSIHWPTLLDGVDYQAKVAGYESSPEVIAETLRPVFDAYEAVSDLPIPAIYEELNTRYPDALFIATVRDPFEWIQSVRRHIGDRLFDVYERALYWRYIANKPHRISDINDNDLVRMHFRHYADLAEYFSSSERFILLNLADPDCGPRLAAFLKVPPAPMPQVDYLGPLNRTATLRSPSDAAPNVIITPYYKESREILERCIQSVRCQTVLTDHILVADGFPQDWIDGAGVRHICLDRCHADYGDTPRGIGASLAASEGYQAIGFLDADCWLEPEHTEYCLELAQKAGTSSCDYVIALRHERRPDGSIINVGQVPPEKHVDTNCYFFLRGGFSVLPVWASIPREVSAVGDRLFYRAVKANLLRPVVATRKTVNYTCMWESIYRVIGEEPPEGAKPNPDHGKIEQWINALSTDDRVAINRSIQTRIEDLFPLYKDVASSLRTSAEEDFVTLYNAALSARNAQMPFDEVIAAYDRASAAAANRAEALHDASRLCRENKKFAEGYEYARRGLAITCPSGPCIQQWIYDYGLLDEFAVNAYWIGRYDDCLIACKRILEEGKIPSDIRGRVEQNARLAREQLNLP